MKKVLQSALLAVVLAAATLAQSGSPLTDPNVRRVGEMLLCLCGCGSTVTSCNMQHCHFSDPARVKIREMVQAGMSDKQILDAFVKENGLKVLVKPPTEGFNLVGWIMPIAWFVAGLGFVWLVIRRFRRPAPAPAGPPIDDAVLARYQERIDRDLEKLE
ncbi:MAG TPA: cytochrome c-type biogenesis protein CcmH [Bryobacteraceae bacterium]|nr:cytochrome c-type biogenesis protein CcmH [Bryobacteraceae bacterium]